YSPTDNFITGDILDKSIFDGYTTGLRYSFNTLNRKQYASSGKQLNISLSYFQGTERYNPGNILRNDPDYNSIVPSRNQRKWMKLHIQNERYYKLGKRYTLGYLLDGVYSSNPTFTTYKSNLLSTPAFLPLQDFKTLFIENLRSDIFIGGGLKNI